MKPKPTASTKGKFAFGKSSSIDSAGSSNRRQPPPNYFSRREQFRLLILCSMLMLVLVMMNEARKPATWKWLWGNEVNTAGSTETDSNRPIETRVATRKRNLPIDGFTSTPNVETNLEAQTNLETQTSLEAETTPSSDDPPTPDAQTSVGLVAESNYLPGISVQLLSSIEDNTVMRAKENEAWLTMLSILKQRTQDELVSLSTAHVGFSQLYRQTDTYRGKLVTVEGFVRRLEEIQPRENDAGIDQLFRWIVQPNGGANSPLVIYSLEKPTAFTVGDDLSNYCQFTGFYFKNWAYGAGDGTRIAPLLLAKTATWESPAPAEPISLPSTNQVIGMLFGCILFSTIIAFVVYRSSIRKSKEIERVRTAIAGDVNRLHDENVLPSVQESLQALAVQSPHDSALETDDGAR